MQRPTGFPFPLRHQNQGLSLAQLVAAGEEAWLRAQRHYGTATEQIDRWGPRWVKEGVLQAQVSSLTGKEAAE